MQSEKTNLFIRKAIAKHGDFYDYSLVRYARAKDKVSIICRRHGVFLQAPQHHIAGSGCNICGIDKSRNAKRLNTESFIEIARLKHSGRYCYSMVDYVDDKTKVTIICEKHGEFKQDPSNHSQGQGCPSCVFTRDQVTSLYLMTNGSRVKVGITTSIARRYKELSKSSPFSIMHIASWKLDDFNSAYMVEQKIHRKLSTKNAGYTGFDGCTEWFDADHSSVERMINAYIGSGEKAYNTQMGLF